ncbi:MAG TPA: hypothetical protein VNB03_11530 [Casimicrobiaceae bacterium]|jgi:hypothetical protein|nr:hypothetical protein [Casimicrobiaceae bacterium]
MDVSTQRGFATPPGDRRRRGLVASLALAFALVALPAAGEPPVPPPAPEIDSSEQDGRVVGEIRARIGYPFETVALALGASREWCSFAILHPNIKGCICEASPDGERLTLYAGPKRGASLEDAYPIRYSFAASSPTPQRLDIRLRAAAGPLKTRDYEFAITAEAAGERTTRLVVRYAYRPSMESRLATAGYLATVGAGKHGFTIVGKDASGRAQYIGGVRGIVERNAMRQLLAVEAYLDTRAREAGGRDRARLERFHALTERHAEQLRELERDEYLTLKTAELERQQERQRVADTVPR